MLTTLWCNVLETNKLDEVRGWKAEKKYFDMEDGKVVFCWGRSSPREPNLMRPSSRGSAPGCWQTPWGMGTCSVSAWHIIKIEMLIEGTLSFTSSLKVQVLLSRVPELISYKFMFDYLHLIVFFSILEIHLFVLDIL